MRGCDCCSFLRYFMLADFLEGSLPNHRFCRPLMRELEPFRKSAANFANRRLTAVTVNLVGAGGWAPRLSDNVLSLRITKTRARAGECVDLLISRALDRKSTRLNSSHPSISY